MELPALPPGTEAAATAVLFEVEDATISALAIDPSAGSPLPLALAADARLEVRTFACDRSVLGLDSQVVRYGGSGAVLECRREGVPCGLTRHRWAAEEENWLDSTSEPNIPWWGPRPDPEAGLTAYGPVEFPPLVPGAELLEQWVATLDKGLFLVAFKVVGGAQVQGTQVGRYRFHADADPPWLQLEGHTLTSTAWIGGRRLPDGRVAMISDTGLSGFLDPEDWTITPGPAFDRAAAICEHRPGASPERSLRGTVEYWDPGDGGPGVLWAGTSCGGVLRRRLDEAEWRRLDPGGLGGSHVHLYPYGPDRALVAGIGRSLVLHVTGDRSNLEPLSDDGGDVEYVGPGPGGTLLAAGKRPLLDGTRIYRREGSGWVPFLEVSLGARAFGPIDDGLLVTTTLVRQPVLYRIPGQPYGEEEGPVVDLRGALVSDLRPIGPRSFGAITFGPGRRAEVSGAVVLVVEPVVRCDRGG